MTFPDYRSHFLGATDSVAYTAIRSKVDGTSAEISGIGGQELDNSPTLENTPAPNLDI